MIMSNKTQCLSCIEYGRLSNFPGWCCRGFDENGKVHIERAAKKSNCWCLDYVSNGKSFNMEHFHVVGKYLTERYGTNVKLVPVTANDAKFGIKGVTDFKVEIRSSKLKSSFTAKFSTIDKKGMQSFKEVFETLKNYEVQRNE